MLPTRAAVTPPGGESIQGPRAVYAVNLTPDFQSVLEQFPLASEYRIEVDIPENLSLPIEGHLEVDYHNQESVPLTEIIFRLFANYNGGEIVTSSVQVDQTAVETSLEASDTTLVLGLRQPLAAGEGVTISMDFSLTVPTEFGGNYGLLSYIDQILVLDLFYPMIPAYDQIRLVPGIPLSGRGPVLQRYCLLSGGGERTRRLHLNCQRIAAHPHG